LDKYKNTITDVRHLIAKLCRSIKPTNGTYTGDFIEKKNCSM